jgi:hypothetical protein
MGKRHDKNGKHRRDRRPDHATERALPRAADHHDLLVTLTRELFQSERSASLHPLREAERLGDVPPAHALRRVAEHAGGILERLPDLARAHRLPVSHAGKRIGELFSDVRELFADRLIDPERSYRGTILGMRHGIDLVALLGATASAAGDEELAGFCAVWREERLPLVEACAEQLAWFATHPAAARRSRARRGIASMLDGERDGAGRPALGEA